jgi:hypothetical protein
MRKCAFTRFAVIVFRAPGMGGGLISRLRISIKSPAISSDEKMKK